MAQPLVSAVILNYRAGRQTWKCVQALLRQTVADRMEIVIIDNHSDDDSIGYLRNQLAGHENVRIVETRGNLGFGSGYNLGFRHATGKYLLINNPAKILDPEAVETMVKKMESDPEIGILGPKLSYDDGTVRDSYRSFPRPHDVVIKRTWLYRFFPGHMRRYLQWDRNPDQAGETDWVVGGCLMIPRDFCDALGGFDENFFLFFEDTDLCRRCWQAGKKVFYLPEAHGVDRKSRLSEGGAWSLLTTTVGRAHIGSAVRYFWKWRSA